MNPDRLGLLYPIDPLPDVFNVPKKPHLHIDPLKFDEPVDPYSLILKKPDGDLYKPFIEKDRSRHDLNLNIIEFSEIGYKRYDDELTSYIHAEQNYIEKIAPKYELNFSKLSKYLIKDMIQQPVIQQIQKPSMLPPISPPMFSSRNLQNQYDYLDFSATKPEDLAEMALPVLEFMENVQPHIVIGCDRGGRLFGLALHATWQQTREGQPFPTLDAKLHFARVSKSEDPDVLQEKVDQIVASSRQFGDQRGNTIAGDEQLRVLFIDDWVIGGGTMRLAQRLMQKHGAQTYFAVMCGEGADATGNQQLHTTVSWHDQPEEIGVNYLSTVRENEDGTITQQQEVVAVRAKEAVRNRQRIQRAAKSLQKMGVLEKVA